MISNFLIFHLLLMLTTIYEILVKLFADVQAGKYSWSYYFGKMKIQEPAFYLHLKMVLRWY